MSLNPLKNSGSGSNLLKNADPDPGLENPKILPDPDPRPAIIIVVKWEKKKVMVKWSLKSWFLN